MTPSQGCTPRSSPPTTQPSSTMRPIADVAQTMSLIATAAVPFTSTSRVGSSTTRRSPASARAKPSSIPSGVIAERKPTRPKLTPITGTAVPRNRCSARSIVPSPPRTTARSTSSPSTTSAPDAAAIAATRARASAITFGSPWAQIAIRRAGSDDGAIDPVVELAVEACSSGAVDEVEEELTVSFRAGQARVYGSNDLRIPFQGRFCDLSCHSRSRLARGDDTALAHVGPPGFELGLDEHDRLPVGSSESQSGWKRLADGDERHVADH